MPSQTYIVRAHARTVHTTPLTFICAKCEQMTTRQCYPGKRPIYCLQCSPKRNRGSNIKRQEKGMFKPTHYLITPSGKKSEVCLERSRQPGWYWVRTALDWFSGESIIRYHQEQGLYSYNTHLENCRLENISAELSSNVVEVLEKINPEPLATLPPPTKSSREITQRLYSGREICRRFRCGDRLLGKMRSEPDFRRWSQLRDPEGISWEYRQEKYFPISLV